MIVAAFDIFPFLYSVVGSTMDYKTFHLLGTNLALLLAAILCMPRSAASQYKNTFYVTPNVSTCTKVNYTCLDFKTYFNNASYYFQSGTEFIFLPGVHLFDLGSFLSVQDIVNMRLVGSDNFTQRSVAEDVEEYGFDPYAYDKNISYHQSSTIILCTNPSGLLFSNVLNLTLSNLTIINCGQNIAAFNISTGIYLSDVYDLLVDGLSVRNSSGYGLFGVNVLGQSQIMRSSFVGSNQYVKNNLQQVPIKNCMNEVGRLYVPDNSGFGGNIIFQYSNEVPTTSLKCQINIFYVLVALGINDGPYGAGLTLISNEDNKNLTVYIDNIVTYRNNGYNGTNFYISSSSNASVMLTNIFSAYATSVSSGGLYEYIKPVYQSLFTVKNSIFECNFSEQSTGSSLYIYILDAFHYALVENCTFRQDQTKYSLSVKGNNNENVNKGELTSSSVYGSSISIDGVEWEINNCVLQNSTGFYTESVIHVNQHHSFLQSKMIISLSSVLFHGNNTFIISKIIAYYSDVYLEGNNTFSNSVLPSSGGIISLFERSTITFTANSNTIFSNNTATYGGAIYIDKDSSLYIGSHTTVSFINNTAVFTGGAIYVEASTNTTCFYSLNCTEIEGIHLYFDSNYAGDAGSVLYGGNIDTCQIQPSCLNDSTYVFNKITQLGYHNPSTSVISSDSPCLYICDESSNRVCLTDQNVTVYPGQIFTLSLIAVGQRNTIVPTVILVYSIAGNGVIGIVKTLKQCSSYVIPYELNNGTLKLTTESAMNSGQFLMNSYSLDIIILPCPVLFTNSSSCICDPLLQRYNLVCNISDLTVLNTGNIWIGLTSQNSTAYQKSCPFDYCTGNKTINVLDLDSQCSYNRSGVLCGGCQRNLSMTFGTSRCASCSNYYLFLIFVFIAMGLFLVLVVFISKFTVTNGVFNGIVLYANLIRINDNIFFQHRSGYSSFLSVLIAWINLDWGIDTCFYNGMESYAKTWLQFVFPISLIGMVILAARYSTSLSKLFRFNAVPVLSTLVLLSYSNILQIIITIFSPASLNTMNSSADSYVWQYDGNVEYLGKKHLPLFIFGLVVIIFLITPYLSILLLAPCLQARSHWRYLQWVNKLKPFLDSYQAPFKDRYRFWPGVLLFIRLPLYLVFILSDSTPVKMLAIIACALIYMCMAVGLSVYKKWSDLMIEMAFIINISIISSSFLAIGDSGSCGIILFLGVTTALMLTGYIIVYERIRRTWNKVPLDGIRRPMVNVFANADEH